EPARPVGPVRPALPLRARVAGLLNLRLALVGGQHGGVGHAAGGAGVAAVALVGEWEDAVVDVVEGGLGVVAPPAALGAAVPTAVTAVSAEPAVAAAAAAQSAT